LVHDLDQAFELLKKKQQDYTAYRFRTKETMAIFAFFDLAQEFASLSNLYRIAVAVAHFFFNYESCVYTVRLEDGALMLQCCTVEGLLDPPRPARADVVIRDTPYRAGSSFLFPIIGKQPFADKAPLFLDNKVLGMFELHPVKRMSEHESLFFQKYANRLGYNMHNKLLVEQNIEHIRFINQLVSDIEHNVITPNIYYKTFLISMKKNLGRHLSELESLGSILPKTKARNDLSDQEIVQAVDNLRSIHQDMGKKMEEFESHFKHLSLFIETLFRGEHFKAGGYVLKRKSHDLLKDIFLPQLAHYRKRLTDRMIDITEPSDVPSDKDLTIFVDLGLMAQVFANLLSNALKYCQPAPDEKGDHRKYISYNVEVVGQGSYETRNALKFTLFSTGEPISTKDSLLIFEDGYKIPEGNTKASQGHGLHFVNNIVQLHGGHAGCRPRDDGNDFYIILPKDSTKDRSIKVAGS